MSYYRKQLDDWLDNLAVNCQMVLDVGGAQNPIEGRTSIWNVEKYKILDLPEFDLEDEEAGTRYFHEADVIFCLEVFEYLIDPTQALENLAEMIRQTGRIYATFQFVYPAHEEIALDSLRYTEYGIHRLAFHAGLQIKNTWYRIDKSGYLQKFYSEDGMHPAKHYQHHNATGFIIEFQRV